jgi:hypothetical protein
MERPFAIELEYGFSIGRVACKSLIGHDMLAIVIAFGGTVPEEETSL